MTPQADDSTPDSAQPSPQPSAPRRRRLFGALAAGVAAAGAAFAWHRSSHAHGARWGGMRGPMDPETMGKRIDAMVAYVLADVDATPEQKSRIGAIAKAAANELMPLRQQHRDARRQMVELLSAPTVDRARFETMRIGQMQLAETLTRRASQAVLDAAEVLNATQRAALAQKWQQRHSRG